MCGDYFLFLPQKLFVMIGKILGLGAGLAGGIMGGIKSSKAAKAQQKLIDQQRAKMTRGITVITIRIISIAKRRNRQ